MTHQEEFDLTVCGIQWELERLATMPLKDVNPTFLRNQIAAINNTVAGLSSAVENMEAKRAAV